MYEHSDFPDISDELGKIINDETAFNYRVKTGNVIAALMDADRAAEIALAQGNARDAANWLEKGLTLLIQENKEIDNSRVVIHFRGESASDLERHYFKLAMLYSDKTTEVYDLPKAMDYFNIILSDNRHKRFDGNIQLAALRLAKLYKDGAPGIVPDKKLALEWYRRAVESECPRENVQEAIDYIHSLPMISIKSQIQAQAKAEQSLKPEETFPYKAIVVPCLEDKTKCPESIDSAVKEASRLSLVSLTAYSLASLGKMDIDYIQNSFYNILFIDGTIYGNYDLRKMLDESQVYKTIRNCANNVLPLIHKIRNTWFLSLVPGAVAEAFKSLKAPKSWDDYYKQAEKIVQSDPRLRSAFNYDLSTVLQDFPVTLHTQR